MTHLIDNWQTHSRVRALQTTRLLNQADFDIHPNRSKTNQIKQLQKEFNLPQTPHFLKQIHTNKIIEYKASPESDFEFQADACFTRAKNVICAIMSADCLPVLLTDTAGSFVAAVHCGWRSLYTNILHKTIEQIQPKNEVLAWFGPCIQQSQYEVEADFVENYCKQHPNSRNAFTSITKGKSQASLYRMAEMQLNDMGVKHITYNDECTYLDPNYYSWRENQTSYRMATMIWIK